ncbi:MAG: FkbM family methyltransferase [Pirellulaceae bacterium]
MSTIDETLQLGWQQHQAGDLRSAEDVYRQVLEASPDNANAWCFLGMVCHDQQHYDDAIEAYHKAIEIQPDFSTAFSNLGNTQKQQGKLIEAEKSCREALRLKPDYSTAHNNLGVALVAQGRLEEAAEIFEKAMTLMPEDVVTQANLSAALLRQGKYQEAREKSQKALAINPNYAEAHKNQGIVSLLLGDFERGWLDYEWRWQCPGCSMPDYQQPVWDGSSLEGRTILLHHEQGLGDTIQFVRYATTFARQGARVIVKAQKPLVKLLENFQDIDTLVTDDSDLPDFDVHVPMVSIPGKLQTTFDNIPADIPYLQAEESLVDQWRERLSSYDGFKVGIVWQGSPGFDADPQRSIPVEYFSRLAGIPGVRLFSLQKGYGAEQLKSLPDDIQIIDFGENLDGAAGPFMDTAAIMQNLDLLISSDTSVPHLAGALGVRSWVALSLCPDWRWFLDREDSPWYPTLRLFRQETLGDWDNVFDRIATDLAAEVGADPPAPTIVQSLETNRLVETGFNCLKQGRHGYLLFNQNDEYIGRALDEYGEFSEGENEVFGQIVKEDDVVVEAGGNIGAHTIALARLAGPRGRVFTFEPQRLVFQALCANIAINSLTNVVAQNVAVGATPGEVSVPYLPPDQATNFGGLGLGDYKTGEKCPVITLDSLELESCRLLKIDVEGMELSVLQGAEQLIGRCRPTMYIENDREDRSVALIEYIQELGYRLFWHLPPMFREDNYFRNPENIFGRIVSVNMLCVHQDNDCQVTGLREIEGPHSKWQA